VAVKRGRNAKRYKWLARPEDIMAEGRAALVYTLMGRVPETWKDLYSTCGPLTHKPPSEIREAVEAWAQRWGLVDRTGPARWAVKCALFNLFLREEKLAEGEAFLDTWAVPIIECEPPAGRVYPYPPPGLREVAFRGFWLVGEIESMAEARQRILDEFTRALDEHIEKYKAWAQQAGLPELPVKRSAGRHLEWLVDYQVRGLSVKQIADAYAAKTGRAVEQRAIYKGLAEAAKAVGLKLRKRRRNRN